MIKHFAIQTIAQTTHTGPSRWRRRGHALARCLHHNMYILAGPTLGNLTALPIKRKLPGPLGRPQVPCQNDLQDSGCKSDQRRGQLLQHEILQDLSAESDKRKKDPNGHQALGETGCLQLICWLRTNGVNTNGAAAEVMMLDRFGTKYTPWHFREYKSRLTGVPKSLCETNTKQIQ